ncbi:MAG: extracellular solute-binding protein [Ruminococcus sp.]|jgi:ABC-type glycerol-3-phosphate transport system substrate-binding protein|nr:extracellular solute-binding protein [Ruminococcus sp.]
MYFRNKLKLIKKITAALLSVILCLGLLIGCGGETVSQPKDYIYNLAEFKAIGENFDILADVSVDGEMVYMLTIKEEAGDNGMLENFYLLKTDLSGSVITKQLLSSATEEQTENGDYTIYMGLSIGSDGSVYLIRQKYMKFINAEGVTEPGSETAIVLRDGETETVLADLNSILKPLGYDTEFMYFDNFEVVQNCAYVTANSAYVWAFDLEKAELIFDNKPLPGGSNGNISGLFTSSDGSINIVTYGTIEENAEITEKLTVVPINPKTGNYGKAESIDVPSGINSYITKGDERFSYYVYNKSSIYGSNGENLSLVADLSASGVNLYDITMVIPISESRFLISGYAADSIGKNQLYMLTKVDPNDVPDKTILTVGAIADSSYISGFISEFMQKNPHYQVEMKLYSTDSSTSFDDALGVLNTEIIAGNVPDVLFIEPGMPYGNYVQKGVFADLYPLIDNDPDIKREDFLQPFLKALETDGKLYSIAPAFDIETLVGKTSVFGEKQGQSIEELQAAAQINGGSLFGETIDRDVFFDRIFKRTARLFVDEEKNVCYFDSPEFISLLEFTKSLPPRSPDAEPFVNTLWMPDETGDYKENRTLIQYARVMEFRNIVSLEKIDFGEPITFLGFPNSSGGTGISAIPMLETAIPAKTKNLDGAWEFVKELQSYGDAFLEKIGYSPLWFFPSLRSELDIAAENATIPPFEYDNFGERAQRLNWLGADLSNQPNNTEADNAKIYALFDSIDGIRRSNPAIENIITEETLTYFNGNKSAAEIADIIQNRVMTYLEELQ